MERTSREHPRLLHTGGAESGVVIVAAEKRDLLALAEVDREAFPDAPLHAASFARLLAWKPGRPRILGAVARDRQSDQVAGYLLYELRARSTHIVRLAVRQPWREAGAGASLLSWLKACHQGVARAIFVGVSEGAADDPAARRAGEMALGFLAQQGFRQLKRLEGTGVNGEDRYLYVWRREESSVEG